MKKAKIWLTQAQLDILWIMKEQAIGDVCWFLGTETIIEKIEDIKFLLK